MADPITFEWEADTESRDAAALLRDLADGVDAGEIALDDGETALTAAVPEALELELEFESAEGEVELEVELEWDDGDSVEVEGPEPTDEEDEDLEAAEADDKGDQAAEGEEAEEPDAPELPEVLTAEDGPSGSRASFEVYRDRGDEWRWRLVHDNGNIIADSGEGYGRRASAVNGLRSVQHNAPGADVSVEE